MVQWVLTRSWWSLTTQRKMATPAAKVFRLCHECSSTYGGWFTQRKTMTSKWTWNSEIIWEHGFRHTATSAYVHWSCCHVRSLDQKMRRSKERPWHANEHGTPRVSENMASHTQPPRHMCMEAAVMVGHSTKRWGEAVTWQPNLSSGHSPTRVPTEPILDQLKISFRDPAGSRDWKLFYM